MKRESNRVTYGKTNWQYRILRQSDSYSHRQRGFVSFSLLPPTSWKRKEDGVKSVNGVVARERNTNALLRNDFLFASFCLLFFFLSNTSIFFPDWNFLSEARILKYADFGNSFYSFLCYLQFFLCSCFLQKHFGFFRTSSAKYSRPSHRIQEYRSKWEKRENDMCFWIINTVTESVIDDTYV